MIKYIIQHPEVGVGLVMVIVAEWYVTICAISTIHNWMKYRYDRARDEAWRREHDKLVKLQKDYDALLQIAEQEASAHKIALMVLRKADEKRKKGN